MKTGKFLAIVGILVWLILAGIGVYVSFTEKRPEFGKPKNPVSDVGK